uniref:Thioredoxin domain-containing protein n=1 Tax=Oryza glumipatula TaxID=40148 RepID=A0A0E0B869_9ORYZ
MAWSLGRCWATRHAHSPRPSLPPFHLSFPLVRRRKLAPPRLLRRLKSVAEGAAGCFPASKAHRRQIRRERRQPPPRELRETISDVRALRQSPLSLVAPVHASGAACILLLPRCRILARDHPYYTGYPKDLGPSRIIPFTSERQFVQLLHEGRPVVVAFTIKCTYTHHLDKVLEEAAATFHPHVECPKYPGFCLTRQKNEYPFIEVFYNPEQAASPGKAVDPNVTKYSVKVLPFNYDQSVYGFREYFKKHGFKYFETN